ncbi:cyclic nucleotide-binding domain-containing protein [Actinomadura fibrosa]|uniref:Cyclic nucleotide-binding domain-containing protein n=1 Tax=Actinomadura fibrosa TaxID=111802 RepID=A0ABW2Y4G1_9ACTN|nr:cyclic nucleotide-binding domain-containing protein [Actinomadura fibrosa]
MAHTTDTTHTTDTRHTTGTAALNGAERPEAFWPSLTEAERSALRDLAEHADLPAGTVLCREDEPATRLVVVLSGWAKVCRTEGSRERIIALRGAGDLIGERAALLVRSRSATVVTLDPVEALLIPADAFAAFLGEHDRVLSVLERQLYERLTEDRGPDGTVEPGTADPGTAVPAEASPATAVSGSALAWAGQTCSILFTDIASFSDRARTDDDRRLVRRAMYDLLREAFEESRLSWSACYREDRGDGALIVVPPAVPTVSLVEPIVSRLAVKLRAHNRRAGDAVRMQLRVALHVGPVVPDREGVSGEAVIQAARLLDAPVLKAGLADSDADLGFIVSDHVYDTVVRHASGTVDPLTYRKVKVRVKETRTRAWMYLAAGTVPRTPALRTAPRPAAPSGTGAGTGGDAPPPSPAPPPLTAGTLDVRGDLVLGNKIVYGR